MKPVIICGGIGKKMWPLSRVDMPKHFLPLINGKSLYRLNYETLLKKFRPEEIYLQTTLDQADLAHEQAPDIPKKNFFIEPELRDTGPAMGYMAARPGKAFCEIINHETRNASAYNVCSRFCAIYQSRGDR